MLNQFILGLQPKVARSISLHYPKSIAQVASLAETTELAVKAYCCIIYIRIVLLLETNGEG